MHSKSSERQAGGEEMNKQVSGTAERAAGRRSGNSRKPLSLLFVVICRRIATVFRDLRDIFVTTHFQARRDN
jgi:hypothetical protein